MAAFVVLVFFAVFCVAVAALVRGRVQWARIASRKAAGVVLAASFVGMGVAGALLPAPQKHGVTATGPSSTTTSTTTVGSTSTTVDLTTTSSSSTTAPPTTTTAPSTTTTTARAATTTTSTAARVVTTTTAAPPPASCSATASPPNPTTNTHEQVSVTSDLPNSSIAVAVHYKTTTSNYTGGTDSSGAGVVSFSISHATSGYRVVVDVTVGGRASCSTSFTPA